jgi:F-type H+-transporting ATPase subunit c
MLYLTGLALITGLTVAIAAVAGSTAQGRAVAAAVESLARQPEAGGRMFTFLILGLALIEALTIYALVVSLLLSFKLPPAEEVLKVISGG